MPVFEDNCEMVARGEREDGCLFAATAVPPPELQTNAGF